MEEQNNSCNITDEQEACCNKSVNKTKSSYNHWHDVYKDAEITELGWYEDESIPSFQLIQKCNVDKNGLILNVGAGSTTLIDSLLEKGYTNLIANDISIEALNKIKGRLGAKGDNVNWICDDLVNPTALLNLPKVDVWNDRAVLHFFIDKMDQDAYFKLLDQKVRKDGYVILAVFNLDGAERCSGLPVKRYNAKMLQQKLGSSYKLKDSFNYIYTMPNGDHRNYVYTLFQKTD